MSRYTNPIAGNYLFAAVGVVVFVLVWQASASIAGSSLLPTPFATVLRLSQFLSTDHFWVDITYTCYRWIGGFTLGCLVGAPLGLAMGVHPRFYASLSFVFDFLRSLPVTAIFPLFLLIFGIGDGSKIAMVFTGTVFVIAINAAYGIIHSTKARVRMARTFGATERQIFRYIHLYEAAPEIVVGMKSTISISLIVVIVSEMFIGTDFGLGQEIFVAYQKNLTLDLFAVLLVVGTLGYFSNALFGLIEKRTTFWAGQ